MPELVISQQNIAAKKIEIRHTLNGTLQDIEKKLSRYKYHGKTWTTSYDAFLDVLSHQAAVEAGLSRTLLFHGKTRKSNSFSFYVGSVIGLDKIDAPQEDETKTKEFFDHNSINFDRLNPAILFQLTDTYEKIVDICAENRDSNLEQLTAKYFEWIKYETLKHSEDKSIIELDQFLRKNPVIIKNGSKDRKFDSFGEIVVHTLGEQYRWKNIGGYHSVKAECMDLSLAIKEFEFMKKRRENPLPKGILFYGPPGTGKTKFARTIANESGVPYECIDRSSIASTYTNGGVEKMAKLLSKVSKKVMFKNYPAAIVFIDELDSVAGVRSDHKEDNKVVATLLTHMDDIKAPGLIYIGATNRPDIIDPALKRPGRFDRMINIGYPDEVEREDIFKVILDSRKDYAMKHNNEKNFYQDINFADLANKSDKFTGAEIERVIDNVIWNQSMSYLKNKSPINPITTKDILHEINIYKERRDNE